MVYCSELHNNNEWEWWVVGFKLVKCIGRWHLGVFQRVIIEMFQCMYNVCWWSVMCCAGQRSDRILHQWVADWRYLSRSDMGRVVGVGCKCISSRWDRFITCMCCCCCCCCKCLVVVCCCQSLRSSTAACSKLSQHHAAWSFRRQYCHWQWRYWNDSHVTVFHMPHLWLLVIDHIFYKYNTSFIQLWRCHELYKNCTRLEFYATVTQKNALKWHQSSNSLKCSITQGCP